MKPTAQLVNVTASACGSVAPVCLELPPDLEQELRVHALAAWPEEACGALFGAGPRRANVSASLRLANVAADRRSGFSISPRDYLAAEAEAERRGDALLGFYHSHPDGSPTPSAGDVASTCASLLIVIVAITGDGQHRIGAFRTAVD